MEDQRQYALLVSAFIFAARKLADWDGAVYTPRSVSAIEKAIRKAEKLLATPYRTPRNMAAASTRQTPGASTLVWTNFPKAAERATKESGVTRDAYLPKNKPSPVIVERFARTNLLTFVTTA